MVYITVVDLSIDFHSTISDIKIYHVAGVILKLIRKYSKSLVDSLLLNLIMAYDRL